MKILAKVNRNTPASDAIRILQKHHLMKDDASEQDLVQILNSFGGSFTVFYDDCGLLTVSRGEVHE